MSADLLYIANCRMPTERAHGWQIVRMCEAFAAEGIRVTLVVPRRVNHIREDIFIFYGVSRIFTVRYLPCIDFLSALRGRLLKFFVFKLEAVTFGCSVLIAYLRSRASVFTRDQFSGFFLSLLGKRVFFEIHDQPRATPLMRCFMRRIAGLVTTNKWKGEEVTRVFGFPLERVLVVPNAVDAHAFNRRGREEARIRLRLPRDKKIVLYTGHLYRWKGVFILAESVEHLSPEVVLVCVGGTEEGRVEFERFINATLPSFKDRITVVGFRPHEEIPLWLAAADVAALPTGAEERIGRVETSPLKLFEYMAAERPVVATDVPSHREVVSAAEVQFVAPDDPEALARGIETVLRDTERTKERVACAAELVKKFTWESRARKILEFIERYN